MVKFLRWFFGIALIVTGIASVTTTLPAALLLLLAGLLLLPPTFTFISQKTGIAFAKPAKYASVILLYLAGAALLVSGQDAEAAAKAAAKVQQEAEKKKQEQLAFEKLPQAAKDSIARVRVKQEKFEKLVLARQDSVAKEQKARAEEYELKKARKEKVDAQFSGYDGSHRGVEAYLKEHMNDPDSYEHVSTRFIDKGDYIVVMTQFRGKNAFGGKVLNSAVAKVDFDGNVLSLDML